MTLLKLFILAATLRLAFLVLVASSTLANPDTPAYELLADGMRDHGRYSAATSAGPGGFPADLQRPPGYPSFLYLIDLSMHRTRARTALVQCFLGADVHFTSDAAYRRQASWIAASLPAEAVDR